jgi:O-antigen ligase
MIKRPAPQIYSAWAFFAHGHVRAALAVIALRFLRTRWLYFPLSLFLTLIIYLYAIRPMLRLVFP